jgi:hypothetical protein
LEARSTVYHYPVAKGDATAAACAGHIAACAGRYPAAAGNGHEQPAQFSFEPSNILFADRRCSDLLSDEEKVSDECKRIV